MTSLATPTLSPGRNESLRPTADQPDVRWRVLSARSDARNDDVFGTNAETQAIEDDAELYATVMMRRGAPGRFVDAHELFPELDEA